MEDILRATANSLAYLQLPFRIEEDDLGPSFYTDDGTRLRLRPHCLEISRAVLESPTEKQKSIAFWYEAARPAESTFFFIEKEEEGDSLFLRLAVRLPIPKDRKIVRKSRLWRSLISEALEQIAIGEKKIDDGSWGDIKPEKAEKDK